MAVDNETINELRRVCKTGSVERIGMLAKNHMNEILDELLELREKALVPVAPTVEPVQRDVVVKPLEPVVPVVEDKTDYGLKPKKKVSKYWSSSGNKYKDTWNKDE